VAGSANTRDTLAVLDPGVVDGLQRAAEHRALRDRGVEHSRQLHVGTELRASVRLGRHVQARLGFPQQREARRILERRILRNRQRRRVQRQVAEAGAPAARGMQHNAFLDGAFARRYAEAL
jgi:hypothetical protein